MPRIPFQASQPLTPSMKVIPSGEGKELQKLGAVMIKSGEEIGDIVQAYEYRQKIARIASQEFQVKTQMYRDQADLDEQLEKRTDYGNFEDFVKEQQTSYKDRYKEIATEPEAWNRLQPVIEHGFTTQIIGARHKARKLEIEGERSNYFSSIETYSNLIGKSNPTEAEGYVKEFSDYTKLMVQTGVIDASVGRTQIDQLRVRGEQNRIERMVRENPAKAKILLEEGGLGKGIVSEGYINERIREANATLRSLEITQDAKIKDVQKANMDIATEMVMSTRFEVNGQKVVMSREQKEYQLDEMYKQVIPGTKQKILSHEDYLRLKAIIKPPKAEKDRVALVPFTHQTDGDTVYVNKYDADEVARVQGEGYKPGTVIKKVDGKESKSDKLLKALGGDTGQPNKQQPSGGKPQDRWIYQNGKLVKQ